MEKTQIIRTFFWTLISLLIILIINLVVIALLGLWHPVLILIALSALTFFEAGILSLIGGIYLMVGGFPSLGRALQENWTPETAKETRANSYIPLLLAGFLFLVSILTSFLV